MNTKLLVLGVTVNLFLTGCKVEETGIINQGPSTSADQIESKESAPVGIGEELAEKLALGRARRPISGVEGFEVRRDGLRVYVTEKSEAIMESKRRVFAPGKYRVEVQFTPVEIRGEPIFLFLAQSYDVNGSPTEGRSFVTRMQKLNYTEGERMSTTLTFTVGVKSEGGVAIPESLTAHEIGFGIEPMRGALGSSYVLHSVATSFQR